jgi:hypothetical protein
MLIQIRFNTEKMKDPTASLPAWRVIYEGLEHLADDICIEVPCWSTTDEISPGVWKWHITCDGVISWDGKRARISAR